jgi:translation initiation factor eIF-2B subunit alpha
MVADAAIACALEVAHIVLLGTEAVTENGGLVSQIGTYQIAMVAKATGKPCFAVAESYKFVRRLPLTQNDLPSNAPTALHGSKLTLDDTTQGGEFEWLRPHVDFTPPEYITLFVTDLGVLTPAGIGDELFRLYG